MAVTAGEQTTVEIPCAEIVGAGVLETPGTPGCALADGTVVSNTMAVPGFLNLDYVCGGEFGLHLMSDVDDLDGDGDVDELIISSDGFLMHSGDGGPTGHSHSGGMMHMGGM